MSFAPKRKPFLVVALCLMPASIGAQASFEGAETTLQSIDAPAIRAHMSFLADDLLEGRKAGERGFRLAANYVAAQYRLLGLDPLLADGTYFQWVPARNAKPITTDFRFALTSSEGTKSLDWGDGVLLQGDPFRTQTLLSVPLVFVRFGVTAPDQQYDDYTQDVSGKMVVVLGGAPASFPEHERAYYGSVEVKQDNAIDHGALGILEIRETPEDDRFNWAWLIGHVEEGETVWLDTEGRPHRPGSPLTTGWLNRRGLDTLLGESSVVDAIFSEEPPTPFEFPGVAEIRLISRHTHFTTPNVIGRLPGSDPQLATEHVVYTAHLDHVGIGEPIDGDAIYNGAVDNASGVAAVLAIARAFTELPNRPRRSILFFATTAEEAGLVGSDYFVNNPPPGIQELVAVFNIDGATLMLFPLQEVSGMGAVHSSLAQNLSAAAERLNLKMNPEPIPLLGSDHYPFVRRGVPALWVIAGAATADPALDGRSLQRNWITTRLHTPQDDMHQPLDFGAAALLSRLIFLTGYDVASQSERPTWNEGDFFGEMFRP